MSVTKKEVLGRERMCGGPRWAAGSLLSIPEWDDLEQGFHGSEGRHLISLNPHNNSHRGIVPSATCKSGNQVTGNSRNLHRLGGFYVCSRAGLVQTPPTLTESQTLTYTQYAPTAGLLGWTSALRGAKSQALSSPGRKGIALLGRG